MATMTIQLPTLHPTQREVARSPARYRVLACGRRWGKTRLVAALAVAAAARGGRAWYVAPTYPMATVAWRQIRDLARQIPIATVRESDRIVTIGRGEVRVRSADDPDSLRGESLDLVVLDECALLREDTWSAVLRPALADRRGRALFVSTPRGHNWFWHLYQQAHDGGDWQAWRYPTSANPYIAPAEIEAARREMPELLYRQEFEAEFIADAGGVFRRVVDAATARAQERAVSGHEYVFGVDWGKHADFTVIAVIDATDRALVALDRFSGVDYTLQIGRLRALAERFRPRVIVAERNAMGEPLIEHLQRDGLPVQPFTTTTASKTNVIEALALAFERGDLAIIADQTLITELHGYEMQRLPSGMLRYSASAGMHDDCVMALALAWSAVDAGGPLVLWEGT